MKTPQILIPALWITSLAAAFVIGGKMNNSPDNGTSNDGTDQSRRPAYRQSAGSADTKSSSRRTAGNRGGDSGSGFSRELNIQDIAKNDDPIARANDLLRLINRLGPNDFAQVVTDFRELGMTRERWSEYSMLLHAWAKVDPLGALDYAEKNTGSPHARQTILASWASSDVEGALAWAKNHHEGDDANPWMVGVIRGVAKADPARATQIMLDLPYSRERGDALRAIVPHIAQQGFDAAGQWLDSITDDSLKSGSAARLAGALARQDPAKTAEWVTTLPESEGKERATREVAEEWAERDIEAAVAWTETLNGDTRIGAAREIIGEYARENAEGAASWLQTISGEPGYQRVVESYIRSIDRRNPAMSLAQVPELQNPQTQARYYENILRDWRRRDAEAAEAWMNNNNLSQEIRSRVLRNSNNRGRGQ